MKKVVFLLFFVLSQSYMLGTEVSSHKNFRKELRLRIKQAARRCHKMPSAFVSDIVADFYDNNLAFRFDNDNYKNITITVSCNGMLLYTNFFTHPTNEEINVPLPEELEEGNYSVTIENKEVSLVGYFTVEAE